MRRGWILPRSGNERRQQLHVLVVDVVDLLDAELADAPAPEERPPPALLVLVVLAASASPPPRPPPSLSKSLIGHLPAEAHRPAPSMSSSSSSRRLPLGLGRLGRQAAAHAALGHRRPCGASCARSATASSSSTRTIMWRMTMSNTRSRRSSSAVIARRAVDDVEDVDALAMAGDLVGQLAAAPVFGFFDGRRRSDRRRPRPAGAARPAPLRWSRAE